MAVSMAVGLGAMAVGGGAGGLSRVWRPMVAVGGLIWHREMVMDIKDLDGDRVAGVRTVPVLLGANAALLASLVPILPFEEGPCPRSIRSYMRKAHAREVFGLTTRSPMGRAGCSLEPLLTSLLTAWSPS